MPVGDYGVLVGPFRRFYRDPPNNEGKYLHGHVVVGAGDAEIDCAVDCNHSTANVRYLHISKLDASLLGPPASMGDGFHPLASNAGSGALDYARNRLITRPIGCLALFLGLLNALFKTDRAVWTTNIGDGAVSALQAMVTGAPVEKVLVFGSRWRNSSWGMHDIHCNQGDPPGPFQVLDGVWQDGGVIVRRPDGTYEAFLVMFTTQSLNTDDVTGLPK